jgi:hypothetical protein
LRDRRTKLREEWHKLGGQLMGQGVQPGSGFPTELQDAVAAQYKAFLAWDDELTFKRPITEAAGAYEAELVEQELKYRALSQAAAKALQDRGEDPKFKHTPKPPPAGDDTNWPLIGAGAGIAALLIWAVK